MLNMVILVMFSMMVICSGRDLELNVVVMFLNMGIDWFGCFI